MTEKLVAITKQFKHFFFLISPRPALEKGEGEEHVFYTDTAKTKRKHTQKAQPTHFITIYFYILLSTGKDG